MGSLTAKVAQERYESEVLEEQITSLKKKLKNAKKEKKEAILLLKSFIKENDDKEFEKSPTFYKIKTFLSNIKNKKEKHKV